MARSRSRPTAATRSTTWCVRRRRVAPIRSGWCVPTTPQRSPSTWCAVSLPGASPTCVGCTRGTPTSYDAVRRASATRRWRPTSTARSRSCRRVASTSDRIDSTHGVELFSSHEALLLDYEERAYPYRRAYRDRRTTCPGHLLWVGERTRQLDGAHVAFAASIANPVAVKLGPTRRPRTRCCWSSDSIPTAYPGGCR